MQHNRAFLLNSSDSELVETTLIDPDLPLPCSDSEIKDLIELANNIFLNKNKAKAKPNSRNKVAPFMDHTIIELIE